MKVSVIVIGLVSLISASAFAQKEAKTPVVFGEMRDRCAQVKGGFGDFRQVVPPRDLVITCTEIGYDYQPMQPGTIAFNNTRAIVAEMTSNKFDVAVSASKPFPVVEQKGGQCARYKQVKTTYTYTNQTGCAEIADFKGDEQDFCNQILGGKKGQNPKAGVEDTGVYIDTCK